MCTILLAEDDDSMRRFLARALERAGYDVVSYGNGAEAFEGLKEKPITLLLTDIVMPEMDGIELAKRASELQPGMKIMFITGFAAVALQEYPEAPRQSRIYRSPSISRTWSARWTGCWRLETCIAARTSLRLSTVAHGCAGGLRSRLVRRGDSGAVCRETPLAGDLI